MRSQTALLILSLATLASCATGPQPSCELATVPAGAVFGVREGIDIATYPPKMSPGVTGCQRVWYGERERPQAMNVMATYYYDKGVVRRLVGTVPGGAGYDCQYRDGALDVAQSRNPAQCPKASEVDKAR